MTRHALVVLIALALAPAALQAKAHSKHPKKEKPVTGPFSEEQLWKGVDEAMQGPHAYSHTKGKCLQFAADVVRHAGAPNHFIHKMPWWEKLDEQGKCVCRGDEPGRCKGGQRVQNIFDPWAR